MLKLLAKLGLDGAGFRNGMQKAGLVMDKAASFLGRSLAAKAAAGFSVAALVNFTKNLINFGREVKDASNATGVSVEAVQTLGFAAKATGSDLATVTAALGALSKSRQTAMDNPASEAAQVFRALGIDAKKLKEMNLDDVFREIGRALEANDWGASAIVMLQTVLGRAGAELGSMFVEGLTGLEKEANAFGAVMDEGMINELHKRDRPAHLPTTRPIP